MTRPTLQLDTALLARRLWLAQIAEQRGCTMEEAAQWEQEQRLYKRLYAVIGAGILFTVLLILWGA